MYRLYIDDFKSEKIWAIDQGELSEFQKFREVIINSVGITKYNMLADNVTQPKVWLEFPNAKLIVINDIGILR